MRFVATLGAHLPPSALSLHATRTTHQTNDDDERWTTKTWTAARRDSHVIDV
jgi:hypothetical protein